MVVSSASNFASITSRSPWLSAPIRSGRPSWAVSMAWARKVSEPQLAPGLSSLRMPPWLAGRPGIGPGDEPRHLWPQAQPGAGGWRRSWREHWSGVPSALGLSGRRRQIAVPLTIISACYRGRHHAAESAAERIQEFSLRCRPRTRHRDVGIVDGARKLNGFGVRRVNGWVSLGMPVRL